MTLADCLCGLWAVGSVARLWPAFLARLGLGWWEAAFGALAVPLLAGWSGTFGLSVGTVLWPLAAGAVLVRRLGAAERERALQAALIAGLVVLLGRAVAQGATSVPAAAVAGVAAAAVAGRERPAAAGALLGLSQVPALVHTAAATAAAAAGAADDLIAGVAVAVAAAAALGAVGRRRRSEGRVRL